MRRSTNTLERAPTHLPARLLCLAALALAAGCASPPPAKPPAPAALQKGSLANQKLVRDTMPGVAGKSATLGCQRIESVDPYILAMPSGTPGSRTWQERWVVGCAGKSHPIDIVFTEAGLDAANYTIR